MFKYEKAVLTIIVYFLHEINCNKVLIDYKQEFTQASETLDV